MSRLYISTIFIYFFLFIQTGYGQISQDQYDERFNTVMTIFATDVERIYGKELQINIWDNDGKAFVQCREEFCEIVLFSGFFKNHTLNQLNALLCHELGHFLGEKFTNNSVFSDIHDSFFAVEGEADYFSTSICLKKITTLSETEMKELSYSSIAMTGLGLPTNLDGKNPYMRDVRLGINMSYPSQNCRYATLVAGIYERERPSCWYIPNELIPIKYRYEK